MGRADRAAAHQEDREDREDREEDREEDRREDREDREDRVAVPGDRRCRPFSPFWTVTVTLKLMPRRSLRHR